MLKRFHHIARDQAGLTLVEIIAALGITLVGLIALVAAMPLFSSHVVEAKFKTTAVFLAQHGLEQIKNARWQAQSPPAPAVPVRAAVDTFGGAGSDGTQEIAAWPDEGYNTITINGTQYPLYRRTVRITDCSVAPGCPLPVDPNLASLRQVTVTVLFRPMTGAGTIGAAESSVQVTSLIAQRQ